MATSQRIVINIRDASGQRESAEVRRTIARWLVGMTILMVLFCGIFPFDFDFSLSTALSEMRQRFDFSIDELWTTSESWDKFIFYMPLGFALGSLLWAWRGQRVSQIVLRCAIALLGAAAMATMVELSQVFLSRDPSLADIISKTTGSALGFGFFIAFGDPVMRWLARLLVAVRKINDPRVFAIAAGAWLVLAVIAPISARNIGSLSSWEPSYPILIGNETDGVRHWDGTVSNAWLSAAGIDDDAIEAVLSSPDPGKLLHDSLVTEFHLTGHGPYTDGTGLTGDLVWTPNFNTGATPGTTEPADLTGLQAIGRVGVPITKGWWLSTAMGGAAQAAGRISRTQAFTLVLDLANHDLDHGFGWPHIFSISKNAAECDVQLLQDHQNLQLRIRSGATGDGGSDPEFIVPGIFTDTSPHRLVVSYDHGRIRVESSESGERYSIQYLPDAWLVWRLFPSSFWHYTMNSSGQTLASGMYRVVAMLPIGVLLGAMLRILRQRGGSQNSRSIFISGVLAAVVLLETLLHVAAGVPLGLSSPVVALLAACAGTWLVLGYLPVRQQWV